MTRFLSALFVLACFVMFIGVTMPRAEIPTGGAMRHAKDEIIAANAADGIKFRKLTDEASKALSGRFEKAGVLVGRSYIVFWSDNSPVAAIAIFDEHNCFAGWAAGGRDRTLKIIGVDA